MTHASEAPHPDEGTLVRFVDDELNVEERSHVAGHLEACAACAGLVGDYRRESAAVRALYELSQEDAPVPPWATIRDAVDVRPVSGGPRAEPLPAAPARDVPDRAARLSWQSPMRPVVRPWAAAASMVVITAALAAASPPARRAVVDAWRELSGASADQVPPGAAAARTGRVASQPLLALPVAGELTIEFTHPQAVGSLELRSAHGGAVMVSAIGAAPPLMVRPGGFRVQNGGGVVASYQVVVPVGVASVRIRIGGREILHVSGTQLSGEGRRTLSLHADVEP